MNPSLPAEPEKGGKGAAVFIVQELILFVKLILYNFQFN